MSFSKSIHCLFRKQRIASNFAPPLIRNPMRSLSDDKTIRSSISETRIHVPLRGSNKNVSISVISMKDLSARNALSRNLVLEMLDTLKRLQDLDDIKNSGLRALILKSDVPGIFCAGANLKERQKMTKEQVFSWLKVQGSLMTELSNFPCPTIAAIDGHALGGGLEMALACDIRVVNEKAKVGLVETRLAIIPGAGGTQRLTRLIGIGKAKEHIFVAEPVDGTEAARVGIANHVTSGENGAFHKAVELAEKICRRGPIAVRLAKAAIDDGSKASLEVALNIENAYYVQLLDSTDRSEGMKAFEEKRDPIYTGN